MKYIVSEGMIPYKREIELIFNLFKDENDYLLFIDNDQEAEAGEIRISYTIRNSQNEITVLGEAVLNTGKILYTREINPNSTHKQLKKAVSYVTYKLLEEITGKSSSWGILTGIRPTKLYHKLYEDKSHSEIINNLQKEYLVSQERALLLKEIVERQLKVIPDLYHLDNDVSLYIGIPFCPTKCAYCTFPAYGINVYKNTVDDFFASLLWEIDSIGQWLKESGRNVTTIYFGGGTPTSLEANQLDIIFNHLAKWIQLADVREITVEAGRPDTITIDKLKILKKWNVERISINPQTFTQETLDIIGRDHSVEEVLTKYDLARKEGIGNINMDLIIGLPGEKLENLIHSLDFIEKLQPESLTIHTMALKRASYLTKNKEEFHFTNHDEITKMMDYATKWTLEHGYRPYYLYRQKNMLGNLENIGYSKEGKESIYNIIIMEEKQTIIGIGSGAVSKLIPPNSSELTRLPSPKDPKAYLENVKAATSKKIESLKEIFKN